MPWDELQEPGAQPQAALQPPELESRAPQLPELQERVQPQQEQQPPARRPRDAGQRVQMQPAQQAGRLPEQALPEPEEPDVEAAPPLPLCAAESP